MAKHRFRKNNNDKDFKKKRTLRNIAIGVCICFAATFGASLVGFATNGFTEKDPTVWFEKQLNPDNLIKVDDYLIEDGQDDGNGVKVKIDENGVIKLNGTAQKDVEYHLCDVVLEPGEYTISGIKSDVKSGLKVTGANLEAKAGTSGATFTVEYVQTVSISIYVAEDTFSFNRTIEPCLVSGDAAGSIYA